MTDNNLGKAERRLDTARRDREAAAHLRGGGFFALTFRSVLDHCRRLGRHYVATRDPDALGDESPDSYYRAADTTFQGRRHEVLLSPPYVPCQAVHRLLPLGGGR